MYLQLLLLLLKSVDTLSDKGVVFWSFFWELMLKLMISCLPGKS